MSKVYIISDLHFGHKNLAVHRGFKDADEQDQHIIDCWNSVITKKDTVWILGDIGMEKTSHYHLLDELTGVKKVVLGNHDKPQHVIELLKYVNFVCGMFQYKRGVVFTHCPIHPDEMMRFRLNIHGHMHNKSIIGDPRYINVSAEVIDYTPVLLSDLIEDKDVDDEEINEDDRISWKFLNSKMNSEGFHYCFKHYSNFNEIKDDKFHRLRKTYLDSANKLEQYIKDKYNKSNDNIL